MYWYVVMDGKKLPTPYNWPQEAYDAIDEMRARGIYAYFTITLE